MNASATTISSRLSWNPFQIAGAERRKSNGLKNVCRNWPIRPPPLYACLSPYLLQDRDLRRIEAEPSLRQLADGPVGLQRLDRAADVGDQRAALREHRAVALVGVDLSHDAAVRSRLLLVLRLYDRHVEDQGLARTRLHRVERSARGRGVDERLLGRAQLVQEPVEAGRGGLGAGLQALQVGDARGLLDALRDEDALVRVEVGSREADHLRALGRDRRLLHREVVRLLPRQQDGRERRPPERDVALADAELLRDVEGEAVLEARRVLERGPGQLAVPERRRRDIEPDHELAGVQCRDVPLRRRGRRSLVSAAPAAAGGEHRDERFDPQQREKTLHGFALLCLDRREAPTLTRCDEKL